MWNFSNNILSQFIDPVLYYLASYQDILRSTWGCSFDLKYFLTNLRTLSCPKWYLKFKTLSETATDSFSRNYTEIKRKVGPRCICFTFECVTFFWDVILIWFFILHVAVCLKIIFHTHNMLVWRLENFLWQFEVQKVPQKWLQPFWI